MESALSIALTIITGVVALNLLLIVIVLVFLGTRNLTVDAKTRRKFVIAGGLALLAGAGFFLALFNVL